MRTAIDTNVLSAIWDPEPNARELSMQLTDARSQGSLVICGVVFAEAMAYPGADEGFLREFIEGTGITVDFSLEEEVWRQTGLRYARYAKHRRRSSKQETKRLLADFLIGSHALLQADRLMTLDRKRYQGDFPELTLI